MERVGMQSDPRMKGRLNWEIEERNGSYRVRLGHGRLGVGLLNY